MPQIEGLLFLDLIVLMGLYLNYFFENYDRSHIFYRFTYECYIHFMTFI